MKCFYCGKAGDLRPYGPKGAMVCFSCAMSTPERKAETESNFKMQLNGVTGPVVIGDEAGPYPLEHALDSTKKSKQ